MNQPDDFKYKAVVHDGDLSIERRVYLLALAAKEVWSLWGRDIPPEMRVEGAPLTYAMRNLYRELDYMDNFMSGRHSV